MGGWEELTMGWFWIWPALVLVGLFSLGFAAYQLVQGRGTGSPADSSGVSDPRRAVCPR
jgi:putative membrane protein